MYVLTRTINWWVANYMWVLRGDLSLSRLLNNHCFLVSNCNLQLQPLQSAHALILFVVWGTEQLRLSCRNAWKAMYFCYTSVTMSWLNPTSLCTQATLSCPGHIKSSLIPTFSCTGYMCTSFCLLVTSEVLKMGHCKTTLLTPIWRASPDELYQVLLKLIRCVKSGTSSYTSEIQVWHNTGGCTCDFYKSSHVIQEVSSYPQSLASALEATIHRRSREANIQSHQNGQEITNKGK